MRFDDELYAKLESVYASSWEQGTESLLRSCEGAFESPGDGRLASIAAEMIHAVFSRKDSEAVNKFLEAFAIRGALPERMAAFALYSAARSNRRCEMALPLLRCAGGVAAQGRSALAMELVKLVYNEAHSGPGLEMLYKKERLLEIASVLESAAVNGLAKTPPLPQEPVNPGAKTKPRIALVTINMLEGGQAYAKTAMQFARYVDRSKYDCYEYFLDETAGRKQHSTAMEFSQTPSEEAAPRSIAKMRALGTTVKAVPLNLDWFEGDAWLADEMERDMIDAIVIQGGVASPMAWMGARLARTPVKIAICINANMYQKGVDANIYMSNSINLEKEKAFWQPEWGAQVFLHGGADIEEAARAVPLKRSDYAIPEDAVAFGLLSNSLDNRLKEEYLSCVARVLKACPNAIFVGMGVGEPVKQIEYLTREGVIAQCRWLSWQHRDAFASLKLLDFYYNEFPIGGVQVVIECLACGVPATAMFYSERHPECGGADVVGPEFAVMSRDFDAYVERAIEWIRRPERRARAAKALSERVEKLYSARRFVEELCELAMKIRQGKQASL